MPLLTEPEYLATMDPHPVQVGPDDAPPFDFWDYFGSIPDPDFDGHDFSDGTVSYAWTMPATDCQHVLVGCETANVFLVLILNLRHSQVHGHHLLDLRKLYGQWVGSAELRRQDSARPWEAWHERAAPQRDVTIENSETQRSLIWRRMRERCEREGGAIMDDVRFTAGLLDMNDAARYLGIPRGTFHRWARGYDRGAPLLHVLDPDRPREARVTLIAMAEAWVLWALRDAGVRTQRIRPALTRLQQQFGREYVLVAPELATDGIDVLWDFSCTEEGAGLIEGRTGQYVIREIVADYIKYIGWADDGYPDQLHLRHCEPSKVIVDPQRAFGQPIFEGGRVRMADVAAMLKAGENPDVVAKEHGVSIKDVRTAARVVLGRAA